MTGPLSVLALCGSVRKASFNRRLLGLTERALEAQGVSVEVFDWKAAEIPIYDGDLEASAFPAGVLRMKERIFSHPALLVVTPEYNHNLPGGLKNAIDWASRPLPKVAGQPHPHTQPFRGKLAACMGATNGMGGTIYAQLALREVLNALGCFLMPGALTVSNAEAVIGDGTALRDAAKEKDFARYLDAFVAELKRRLAVPAS
jgi:NAD(P)H-dependent FMN reductase